VPGAQCKMTEKIDFVDLYDFLLKNDVSESLIIEKHGKPHAVMIPYELFEILRNQNRQAMHISELSDEDMNTILSSEIPEELKQFDEEGKK
jgi:PHD/YefM family antitoxin component YafN of YafNO toxin-antitoxin module